MMYGGMMWKQILLDVHIGRLRERFRDNPDFQIVTIRGVGYKVMKK